jgi:hypothetical protein
VLQRQADVTLKYFGPDTLCAPGSGGRESGAVGTAGRKQPKQQLENASDRSGEIQMDVGGACLCFSVGSSQKNWANGGGI